MLRNKINVRIRTKPNRLNKSELEHNTRAKDSKSIIYNNDNYVWYRGEEYTGKSIKKIIPEIYQDRLNMIQDHETLVRHNTGREQLREGTGSITEGIITFPKTTTELIANGTLNKRQFLENGKQAIEKIAKEFNTELLYMSCHFDEKTPHFHFHFRNYDMKKGQSLTVRIKTERLSKLQDIAGECFKNQGFERGFKKELTKARHQTVKQYHEQEIIDLKVIQNELQKEVKKLKEQKKFIRIQNVINETQRKKEYQKIDTELTKIRNIQKSIRDLKKGEFTTKRETILQKIFSKHKTMLSYDKDKIIQDILQFEILLKNEIEETKHITEEATQRLKEVIKREEEINTKSIIIEREKEILHKKLETKNEEIKSLKETIYTLEATTEKQQATIEKQQEEINNLTPKSNTKNNTNYIQR